jgi:hypothetical protein
MQASLVMEIKMNAKQKISELDRELVERQRSEGPGTFAGLPPEIPDTLSATDRRVPVAKLQAGMELPVILKLWELQRPDDRVTLRIAQKPVPPNNPVWSPVDAFDAGPDPRPPTYTSRIPADLLSDYNPRGTDSTWLVQYQVRVPGSNPWFSDAEEIIIDRRAHYQATPGGAKTRPVSAVIDPPFTAYPGVIDETYLSSLTGAVMKVTVPIDQFAVGDQVFFYISREYSLQNPEPPLNPGPYLLPANGVLEIPAATLRNLPANAIYLYYKFIDAVGNESALSQAIPLTVSFMPLPVLDPPIVPLARDVTDKLIDLKDCGVAGGVTVEVDRVNDVLDNDEVKLEWNATLIDILPFGSNAKLIFPVPYVDIFNDYYKDGEDTTIDVPVKVKASLLRGQPTISTSDVDIFSNIYYPGPINPVDPAPPNNELEKPHITSTSVNDVLEPEDHNKNATVTIDLWTDPPERPVETGQQIFGEYVGQRFGPAFLQDGDTTATLTLPWPLIDAGGLGPNKPLQYFVSEIGGVNENPSPIQMVTNNAIVIDLDPPTIDREFADENLLLCEDLTGSNFGAVVKIPGNPTHFLVGREVTLHAQGYRDESLTQESPNTTFASSTPHEIASGDEAGFTMEIEPYDPYIRNVPAPPPTPVVPGTYVGYWKVWYTLDVNGTDYPSEEFVTVVNLVNAQGEYCEQA